MTNHAVRTRFAPSPTGYLHIGSARTALFNFLYARHCDGCFILRMEDTDRERSTKQACDAILDGMRWLGLNWDEGPIYQHQRQQLYEENIEKLLADDHAYVCDCSAELLEEKRKKAIASGEKPKYDGTCRERRLSREKNRVVRFKCPQNGTTTVHDLIKGEVPFDNRELDDVVLVRSNGTPTYNFVVVVDDIALRITHVLRGDDHLNNTPKQLLLYKALGVTPPKMGHLPLILGEDRARLSKRHGATAVQQYREDGFLPEAMINFLARLGWSHGNEEIFSMDDLIKKFNLENIGTSPAVFNQEKLLWLNHHYLRQHSVKDLTSAIRPHIKAGQEHLTTPQWQKLLKELSERCKTLKEFTKAANYFFHDDLTYDATAKSKFFTLQMKQPLTQLRQQLATLERFDEPAIETVFKQVLDKSGVKMKPLAQAVRLALTGRTFSPGIYTLVYVVGQQRTIKRLDDAISQIEETA